MKTDYQKQTDAVTAAIGEARPRLLLQCCCGPCSSYVLEYLCRHFEVTALFYNPNIFPVEEHEKRRFWFGETVKKHGGAVAITEAIYEPERFDELAAGLEAEPEGGARCVKCFGLRLRETAKRAKEGGFDYFCTTLTVSPHKNAELINETGLALERQFGVKWLPSDFKKRGGYRRSIELSAQYGLYRQDYCGCKYSMDERENRQ